MEKVTIGPILRREIAALLASGCDEETIARLLVLRRQYREGRFDELTHQVKHLLFIRWLYRRGRIGG